jgi:SWI/SNF-related matrix-associated actin-dependent regulator of chromatin subfamily A3
MIEEQALCRVHRVGQKRIVTTIRYLIRDSFEEVSHIKIMCSPSLIIMQQIVDIQKRKKVLAQVTFAQGPLAEDGIGLGTLQVYPHLVSYRVFDSKLTYIVLEICPRMIGLSLDYT